MSAKKSTDNGRGELRQVPAGRLLRDLRAELRGRGDPLVAAGMRAYMKSGMPFHGVHVPEMRQLSRLLFHGLTFPSAQAWSSTVWFLWSHARFREEWYSTIALARSDASIPFQRPATFASTAG